MTHDFDLDWLISVDDHVLEPPHVWQSRIAAADRDRAPKIVRDGDEELWVYEGRRIPTLGLAAVAGKQREQFSPEPITYADMRPGCYDSVARLADMDQAGILASLCFPSFTRFCGQVFYEAEDHDLGFRCVQAYNDWMIEEWCGAAPGRYIPMIIIPLWDPRLAATEIERCAAKGARAFAFSENPVPLGLPSIHDAGRYWDPVFDAAHEADMVVCIHQGSSSHRTRQAPDTPELAVMAWHIGQTISGTMLDWVFSSVFQRFPRLRVALSEGDIGWMPYFLQRAEQVLDKQRFWASQGNRKIDATTGRTELTGVSEVDFRMLDVRQVFRDHIFGCFIDDEHGVRNIDAIGIDNVMIETDYPHSDSTWPNSIQMARKQLAGLADADVYKVLRANAERVFRFTAADPATIGR